VDADLDALQRWRDGDQRAGEELCARHFDEIHRFFAHKIAEEADDLTQQTFLACVKARDQFRGQSSFRTYLFAIARNELFMRLRRAPAFQHVDLEASSLEDLVSSPSKLLGRQQELAQLRTALRRLPVEQQLLLEFHYWHDLDAAALAALYEASQATIRVRLVRARQALRAQLGTAPVAVDTADDPLSRSLRDDA
jgi:RNA polymerase sigma-70 factor (ECF subfamily)